MFLLLLYGSLAVLAVWATWRDYDLMTVALCLLFGFVVSNYLFFTAPPTDRPGPFSLIEMLVAVAAFLAWREHRYRALLVLVGFNIVSIIANIAYAWQGPNPEWRQTHLFEVVTNLCFAAECLLVTWAGVQHGYRTGRFRRRLDLRRGTVPADAAREGPE